MNCRYLKIRVLDIVCVSPVPNSHELRLTMKFRNLVLKLHSSIGIVMGLLLMVISLSGTSIVFHEELDHAFSELPAFGITNLPISKVGTIKPNCVKKRKQSSNPLSPCPLSLFQTTS